MPKRPHSFDEVIVRQIKMHIGDKEVNNSSRQITEKIHSKTVQMLFQGSAKKTSTVDTGLIPCTGCKQIQPNHQKCYFCDKVSCNNCIHSCSQCGDNFCNNCCYLEFSSHEDSYKCLNC